MNMQCIQLLINMTHTTHVQGVVVCDIGYFPITIIAHNISRYDIHHNIQTHYLACVFTLMTLVALMY